MSWAEPAEQHSKGKEQEEGGWLLHPCPHAPGRRLTAATQNMRRGCIQCAEAWSLALQQTGVFYLQGGLLQVGILGMAVPPFLLAHFLTEVQLPFSAMPICTNKPPML